jgi:hypothetical protein
MANNPVKIPITATNKTGRAFSSVNKGLKSMGGFASATALKVGKLGVAFGAMGIAAATVLTKSSMQSIDALAKTADQLGVTTEALGSLQHSASLAGVENKTLSKSLQNLAIGVSDAANNTGIAKEAFLELGISAQALEKLPIDQQMMVVADAMKDVKLQTDKVRIAADLFGTRGVAMLTVLAGGSAGLKEMAAEADHLGITISRVDAAQIEVANDAVTRAKGVFTGLGNQLATAFSPIIAGVADSFRQSALDSAEFGNTGQRVADAVVKAFGSALDVIYVLNLAFLDAKIALLEFGSSIVKGLVPKLKIFIDAYNAVARFVGDTEITNPFGQFLDDNNKAIAKTKEELQSLYAKGPPSSDVDAFYEQIKVKTRELAEEIAKNAPAKVMLDDLNTNGEAVLERLSFNEEQQIAGEKKLAAFKQKSSVAQTSQIVGELSTQFSAIAGNNKKLFAANKAFQIANAVMQTYSAATLALSSYPPPFGFIMAAASVANGLGQVAQIKSQSFEGGGFTGNGSRSGGIDGKGGFSAILHPNETVTDHTKGQGSGVTIINNIDASGGGDVDLKIRQAMETTSAATVAQIQDLMRRRRFV